MPQEEYSEKVETMDILIGVTILLCLLLCHLANQVGIPLEALGVTTGAVMCVQDNTRAAFRTSLTRMVGVVCGGMFGIAVALIDNAFGIPMLFYILCSLAVVANLLVCKFFKMIYVQARVSCVTLLLVTMVFNGADRLDYAVNRFIGSLAGALFALLVTWLFGAVTKRIKKDL